MSTFFLKILTNRIFWVLSCICGDLRMMDVKQFLELRQKVLSALRERLGEMESLVENAALILGKRALQKVDLNVIESIVRLLDIKYKALFSDINFIDVAAVDGLIWFDVKRNIIMKLWPMIEEAARSFSRLSTLAFVPEIIPETSERVTVSELKEKLKELFEQMLRTIRSLKMYTPKMLPEDKIKERLEELEE